MTPLSPAAKRFVRIPALIVASCLLALVAFAGYLHFRRTDILIDFTESIAHSQVHPLEDGFEAIKNPGNVELRFPEGWSYTTDRADLVTIQNNDIFETDLIHWLQIKHPPMALDEVVAEADTFQDHWRITDSNLDAWYEERKRSGPDPYGKGRGGGARWIAEADHAGKRLYVSCWITEIPALERPYVLNLRFAWMRPQDEQPLHETSG